jgi:hypothetical protein
VDVQWKVFTLNPEMKTGMKGTGLGFNGWESGCETPRYKAMVPADVGTVEDRMEELCPG